VTFAPLQKKCHKIAWLGLTTATHCWCDVCRFSFKDEKHLVFGFDEFPQIVVDYLDCCIEQDSKDNCE